MTLRIGRIAYLNVVPYFHYLDEEGFSGEIISGVPSELNSLLARGAIDACPSSSFEYGLHADNYFLLPGHSISSQGPVHSVLLFTPGPLAELSGQEIVITGESSTSINLLKILLAEFCGIADISCRVPPDRVEDAFIAGRSVLLIGDRALLAAKNCPAGYLVTDLGAFWYHFTGLPFVFALWILRRDAANDHPEEVVNLARQLAAARERAFADLPNLANSYAASSGFAANQLENYWRGMSYDLREEHLEGLRLYFALCVKQGLLAKTPELVFVGANGL